jgi:hypothetical protein
MAEVNYLSLISERLGLWPIYVVSLIACNCNFERVNSRSTPVLKVLWTVKFWPMIEER